MEKPILFSTEMVRALLNLKPNTWPVEPIDPTKPFKWQSRRLIKPQPEGRPMYCYAGSDRRDHNKWLHGGKRYTPPCHGDDVLWVRETWADLRGMGFDQPFAYLANSLNRNGVEDGDSKRCRLDYGVKWKPSIHMPRDAARLFLKVKRVGVESLQDISEADARAEGFESGYESHGDGKFEDVIYHEWTAIDEFNYLWNTIYFKRGHGWDINPWVWVIELERVKINGR